MTQTQIETLDSETSSLTLSLDVGLYPRDVLYAAAYVFIDRAYVLLDREGQRHVVHLRAKQAAAEGVLRSLAGEFENELLAQALRLRVFKANQKIITDITTLAISGAATPPLEVTEASEETILIDIDDPGEDGFLDDPLGIAAPWEAKKREA